MPQEVELRSAPQNDHKPEAIPTNAADEGAVLTSPLNFSGMMGVYLAVNAVPDAMVLVDGPDCNLYKAHWIQGRHDWNSKLLNINGKHRVCFSNICSTNVVKDHDDLLIDKLKTLGLLDGAGLVLVSALPMCSITGVDYDRIIRMIGKPDMPAGAVPPDSLVGDWLDGYEETMLAMARALDLKGGSPKPENVAVVGYFMDRNEGDHLGNLEEMRRLIEGLGLNLVSVWLSGTPSGPLKCVRDAGTILAMPHGRRAAAAIAARTGAKILEVGLPFGLGGTERWVLSVAKAFDRVPRAESLIERELHQVVPKLEWVLPYLFLHRRVLFMGDPHYLAAFEEVCEDLGCQLAAGVATGRKVAGRSAPKSCETLWEPKRESPALKKLLGQPVDLVISNANDAVNYGLISSGIPVVEFGFPSKKNHVLAEAPFLGFRGFLSFVDRLSSALMPLTLR